MHPVMPFVTETLWPHIRARGERGVDGLKLPDAPILAGAAWPDIACRVDDEDALVTFERVQALVGAVRTLRGERNVKPSRKVSLFLPPGALALAKDAGGVLESLCGADSTLPSDGEIPGDAAPDCVRGRRGVRW